MQADGGPEKKHGVLVAGGTGALGSAVVGELAARGYPVCATWVVEKERDRLLEQLGQSADVQTVHADLFEPDGAQAAVDAVTDLGAVINLVGGFAAGAKTHETDPQSFQHMLSVNVTPGFLLARAAMPRLMAAGGGSFICVSARPAVRPFPGASGYITAKSGVLGLVGALDAEYRDQGVRSNAIMPSMIDTPANRTAQPNADHTRWVPPADIAKVVAFLISDEAWPVSGAAVPVYGLS
jgi:NAD(P)-dependent dehydrogenase (short-subunit alcohol dehydrogenase family)